VPALWFAAPPHALPPPFDAAPPSDAPALSLSPAPGPGPGAPDYRLPRALHEARGPAALAEPIWSVVHDMREQRMSLFQSLRQYVFVHVAVAEGALALVDAARAREARRQPRHAFYFFRSLTFAYCCLLTPSLLICSWVATSPSASKCIQAENNCLGLLGLLGLLIGSIKLD
jgi:hypothetical protein